MTFKTSVEEEQAILAGIKRESDASTKILLTATKATADRVGELHRQYPMLTGGVLLGLVKNNTPDAVVAQIAKETASAANANPDKMNGKPDGNWLSDALKQGTRVLFAASSTASELVQNSAMGPINDVKRLLNIPSQIFDKGSRATGGAGGPILFDVPDANAGGGMLGSTTLATLAQNRGKQGSGWFVSSDIVEEQAKRARAYRGVTDGGHAWTVGRGLANIFLQEDSTAYNFLSGVIDAMVAVKTPAIPGLKAGGLKISELAEAPGAGKALVKLGAVSDTLSGRGVAIKISDLTGDELREAHRLAGISGGIVNPGEANKFLGTPGGRRLVKRLLEADTSDDVRNIIGKNVFADTIKKLRDAKTELDMQAVLADVLGLPQQGLASTVGVKGTKLIMLSNARRTAMLEAAVGAKQAKKVVRGFSGRAGTIGDVSSEAPRDVRDTINNIDNWSKNILLPEDSWDVTSVNKAGELVTKTFPGRRELLDKAVDAMVGDSSTPTARREFRELWQEMVPEAVIKNGGNPRAVKAIFGQFYERLPKLSGWSLGVDGMPDDAGFYSDAIVAGEKISDGAFGGPMLQSELANVIIDMPDPKQIAALTNNLNFLWRKGTGISDKLEALTRKGFSDTNLDRLAETGKLNPPAAAITYVQNKIWRSLVLFTGGFSVRNLVEAQTRLALTYRGVDGAMNHPMAWLGWATHKKGGYDILGESWREGAEGTTASMNVYREAVQAERYGEFRDPSVLVRRGTRSGDYRTVDRSDVYPEASARDAAGTMGDTEKTHKQLIVLAHGDQIGLLNADPVSRMFAQLGSSAASEKAVLDFIRNTKEGQAWFKNVQDYHIKGRSVIDRGTGKWGEPLSVDLRDEQNLKAYLKEISNRVELQTGGDPRLLAVVAEGKLPPTKVANASNIGIGTNDVGSEVLLGAGRKSNRIDRARVVSYNADTDEATVQYFAFNKNENTRQLRQLLETDDVFDNPRYPRLLRQEIRTETPTTKNMLASWDETVNQAFGYLYGKPSTFLDRSPLFRQFYYEMAIDNLLTSLDAGGVTKLYDNILSSAERTGTTPEKFLGDAKRWEKIVDANNGKIGLHGTLTLEEVDAFAKGAALDDSKRLLYDATDRNNYLDSARIVFPFAPAFVEFYKSIGRMYTIPTKSGMRLPNMGAIRKTQLLVEGGREGDPDGDGRGFFYTDPETGEWSFKYPGSGLIGKALTGLNVSLSSPISGAIQGIDLGQNSKFGLKMQPGLGPFVSIAASQFLPDTPIFEDIGEFFLPMGKTELSTETGGVAGAVGKAFMPAWATKALSPSTDNPESITAYGNAVFETLQVLLQSGEYDINDPKQMEDAWAESRSKGKTLTWLRALGQFLGPSRPNLEFQTKSLKGDVFINQAAADLRMFQKEGHATAALKFFDLYGETFFPYLARKTVPVGFGALGISPEFGRWERDNTDFLAQHPLVAGYFAPTSNTFDWQIYTQQLSSGQRRRQSNKDAFDEAQYFSANAQYRYKQKQLLELSGNAELSADDKNILKQVKTALQKQYPAYKHNIFPAGELEAKLSQLQTAAFDTRMDDNPVALATRFYLDSRSRYIGIAQKNNKAGLGAKVNSKLAGALRDTARKIIVEYPEFEVLYERVLSQEID